MLLMGNRLCRTKYAAPIHVVNSQTWEKCSFMESITMIQAVFSRFAWVKPVLATDWVQSRWCCFQWWLLKADSTVFIFVRAWEHNNQATSWSASGQPSGRQSYTDIYQAVKWLVKACWRVNITSASVSHPLTHTHTVSVYQTSPVWNMGKTDSLHPSKVFYLTIKC